MGRKNKSPATTFIPNKSYVVISCTRDGGRPNQGHEDERVESNRENEVLTVGREKNGFARRELVHL